MNRTLDPHSQRAFLAVEALLAYLRSDAEAADLTRTLEAHFGSADALFHAQPHMLEQLGLRADETLLLSRMSDLFRYTRGGCSEERPVLAHLAEASEYLCAHLNGLGVERFCMLSLNERGRLRECVFLQEGTSDGALFSLRHTLAEAIRTHASAVVLAHNHPGLTPRPSPNDIACTQEALNALRSVGIPLLDHVIVAGKQAISLRKCGFVPAGLWLDQDPENPLLRGWLEDDLREDFT